MSVWGKVSAKAQSKNEFKAEQGIIVAALTTMVVIFKGIKCAMIKLNLSNHSEQVPSFQDGVSLFQAAGQQLDGNDATAQLLSALRVEAWPLADNSVSQVNLFFTLELLNDLELVHVFKELNRVCCDGALITVLLKHPKLLAADCMTHAHALNDAKLKLLDRAFRQANPQVLEQVYTKNALEQQSWDFNWECMDYSLCLSESFQQSLAQHQITEQQQIIPLVWQDAATLRFAHVQMVVHKVEGNNFGLVRFADLPRFVMRLYPLDSVQHVSRLIKQYGMFEVEESFLVFNLLQRLQQTKTAPVKLANIGANLGWYSLITVKGLPQLKVDAFEPTPETVEMFKHSIELNDLQDQITVYPYALSNEQGTSQFFVDSENAGSNSLMEASGEQHHIGKVIEITTDTMDHLYLPQPREAWPDVIVMDVEGHEQKVLDGAQQMLNQEVDGQKWQPIIVTEFTPSLMRLRGECTYYKDFVEKRGYQAYVIDHSKLLSLIPASVENLQANYERLSVDNPTDAHLDLVLLPPSFQL